MKKNYYEILSVTRSAPPEVIKGSYRVLAQKYHPDKNKSDPASANALMQRLNEAYEVLMDPAKRAAYDALLDLETAPPTHHQQERRAPEKADQQRADGGRAQDTARDDARHRPAQSAAVFASLIDSRTAWGKITLIIHIAICLGAPFAAGYLVHEDMFFPLAIGSGAYYLIMAYLTLPFRKFFNRRPIRGVAYVLWTDIVAVGAMGWMIEMIFSTGAVSEARVYAGVAVWVVPIALLNLLARAISTDRT